MMHKVGTICCDDKIHSWALGERMEGEWSGSSTWKGAREGLSSGETGFG